jgi:alpha-L-fucosidase
VLDVIGKGPKDGRAVKQAFFTTKGDALYAILPAWPGKAFLLKDVSPDSDVVVTMLGREGTLPWKNTDQGMLIDLSDVKIRDLPCKHAWTLKIQGKI